MVDLLSLTLPELETWLGEQGEPPFRARQLYLWLHRRLESDPRQMTTLPERLRAVLAERATITPVRLRREQCSKDGRTRKVLLALEDGRLIESVLMLFPASGEGRARATACISTQVGCALGCTFCATGQMGFERHLTAGEIVGQVYFLARELRARPWTAPDGQVLDRLTNLVLMGMGEPLHNYEATLKALHLLNSAEGFGLGARHMTVSTVGLVPGILRLSEEALQVNLAISLHAPNDALRGQTMPVTRKYRMEELLEACRTYVQRTNRQITFEYVLLAGVNDAPEHARELGERLARFQQLAHVNLIPVNATSAAYRAPGGEAIKAFREELRRAGVSNSVRAERGDDIAAACGQLKTKERAEPRERAGTQERARSQELARL